MDGPHLTRKPSKVLHHHHPFVLSNSIDDAGEKIQIVVLNALTQESAETTLDTKQWKELDPDIPSAKDASQILNEASKNPPGSDYFLKIEEGKEGLILKFFRKSRFGIVSESQFPLQKVQTPSDDLLPKLFTIVAKDRAEIKQLSQLVAESRQKHKKCMKLIVDNQKSIVELKEEQEKLKATNKALLNLVLELTKDQHLNLKDQHLNLKKKDQHLNLSKPALIQFSFDPTTYHKDYLELLDNNTIVKKKKITGQDGPWSCVFSTRKFKSVIVEWKFKIVNTGANSKIAFGITPDTDLNNYHPGFRTRGKSLNAKDNYIYANGTSEVYLPAPMTIPFPEGTFIGLRLDTINNHVSFSVNGVFGKEIVIDDVQDGYYVCIALFDGEACVSLVQSFLDQNLTC